ncbi:HAMP domain-containing sensor histidine kinase [Massilia sp.]|uniref:sensor histidine kinase n=1 Tax=Massilia sp. TaxID=1882437 RepID=UPI0028A7D1B5|nr:HAMP domain-containing sensor histidine kinase [Massilia sp.]
MLPSESLHRRIVVALVSFGVVLSLFVAVVAAIAVEGIEVHLVDNRLAEAARWASPRQAAGLPTEMPAGLRFHRGSDIPQSLRKLPQGVSEVDVDGVGLHVLTGADAAGPYVMVDHESDYEKVELVVYSMFAAALLGIVLLAALLGRFLASRIVNPISELADAVTHGQTALPLTERADELGILARALQAHTAELRAFLDRERFFTGDVSHELRSPLTVIMGAAEILMTNADSEATRAPAERIYRAAHEAAECVTVLLLLARAPELGRLPPVQVDAIAAREAERYRALVAHKPVALHYKGGPPFAVQAPSELCAAAIGNLVRNACQYTEQGEVGVTLGKRCVIVEDTGPGLPQAVRATLRQPGAASNGVPSTGSAGTGLGLSLVYRICEYLGATLLHEDRAGGGSRFTIVFARDFTQS